MKQNKTLMKTMLITALVCVATLVNAQTERMYLGMRVPQMSNEDRGKIGVEGNTTTARGQLIYNTTANALQFWNGTKWETLKEDDERVEITGNGTIVVKQDGQKFELRVDISVIGDSLLLNQTFVTNLIDTLVNNETFITNFGDEVITYITNNVTEELTTEIMKNVTIYSKDESVIVSRSNEEGIIEYDLRVDMTSIIDALLISEEFITQLGDVLFTNEFMEFLVTNLFESQEFITNLEEVIENFVTSETFITNLIDNSELISILTSHQEFINNIIEELLTNNTFLFYLANNETFVEELINNQDFIDKLFLNNIFLTNIITWLTTNETFIDELFYNEYFVTTLIEELTTNETFITELVTNETFITELVTNETFITELVTNDHFVTNLEQLFINNEEFVQNIVNSIVEQLDIVGVRGIEVTKNEGQITIGLVEGTRANQVLTWNGTTWVAAEQTSRVRQIEIKVDEEFSHESFMVYGTTAIANGLVAVAIEPVFENRTHRRNFLTVDASVEVVGSTAEWSVTIENRNFQESNKNKLVGVVISYISSDLGDLGHGTKETQYFAGF